MFALNPAAAVNGPIDYSTRHGQNMFKENTAPLPMEYDLDPNTLLQFVRQCKERAWNANWEFTTNIHGMDLFDDFGILTTDMLAAHATTYMFTPTRRAQDSNQAFNTFAKSLTPAALAQMNQYTSDYTFVDVNNNESVDGGLYLKKITQLAQVDTVATVNALLTKTTALDALMLKHDSNIKAFMTDVQDINQRLLGRGVYVPDSQFLVNLFKGYAKCTDPEFVLYIKSIQNNYEDGSRALTPAELMLLASNKYDIMVEAGTWNATSVHDKQIVALQATVGSLQSQLAAGQQQQRSPAAAPPPTNTETGGGERKPKPKREYPAWKKKAPGPGEALEKTVNDKTVYWCPHHKLWAAHKPSECRMRPANAPEPAPNTPLENRAHALHLQSIMEGDDESV